MTSPANSTRGDRIQTFLRSPNIPASFHTNSSEEDKLIGLAKQFETLYYKYFPDRRPLLLFPSNECQKQKMICSFVRPTALLFDELFDLKGCCQFVADYIRYEPLYDRSLYEDGEDDCVEELPQQIVSPATTLDWQIGNSFEMSLLLVSFLIGSGFNAYVVVGTAAPAVCLCDQSTSYWEDRLPDEVNSDDEKEDDFPKGNPYMELIPDKAPLRSTADPDPVLIHTEDSEENAAAISAEGRSRPASPPIGLQPVHAWVLVLPGERRSVTEPTFVEPSTGKLLPFSAMDKSYSSVEVLFNHQEYYINMRPGAPVSSLSPNLADGSQWESLFPLASTPEEESEMLTSAIASAKRGYTNELTTALSTAAAPGAESSDSTRSRRIFMPNMWCSELILNRQQYESRYPDGYKEIVYADATVHRYAPFSQADLRVQEVVLLDAQLPGLEEVHIFYANRADKLRRRSTFPAPPSAMPRRATSSSILASRAPTSSFDTPGESRKIAEWYDRGRMHDTTVEGLRELIHEPGRQRVMKFYWRARSDGLHCRTELLYDANTLRKVKEHYKGRSDRLSYRSFSYDRPSTMRETNAHSIIVHGPGSAGALRDFPRLDPIRISEKFLRNEQVPASTDVAKTTFHRPSTAAKGNGTVTGEMWVYFHYASSGILRPYHLFAKPGSSVEEYIAASAARRPVEPPVRVVTLPDEAPPSELDLYNERKWLNAVEATALVEQRARMDECLGILRTVEQDHSTVRAVLSPYDTLRNRPKETEAERARKLAEAVRREESRKDYLAPYIAKLEMPPDFDGNYLSIRLSVEQAKQVRDEALHELKERLIQRGHIMQSRMDAEKEEFNKRQQLYKKNCDTSAVEGERETEAFALYCKEATWKMKVLDDRLSQHIDHASDKYNQLAQRLSEDPRLEALYHPSH